MTKERNSNETPSRSVLWHFTPREEMLMRYACRLAREFMQKYGKGALPQPIDKRFYFRGTRRDAD